MSLPSALIAWEYEIEPNLVLRGARTEWRNKPVIHFIHGNGFCSLTYWSMLQPLTENFDLFLHDIQAHGDSDNGQSFVGWNRTAQRCSKVLKSQQEFFQGAPIYAIGHSFGGIMSLLMAGLYDAPIDRMILLDPVLYPHWIAPLTRLASMRFFKLRNPMARQARARQNNWSDVEQARAYLHNRGIFKGWHEQALDHYLTYATQTTDSDQVQLKCPPWMEGEIFASFPHDLWQAIGAIEVDTQILYGNRTLPFIPYSAARAARQNSHIRHQTVSGGHCFMLEDPIFTCQIIEQSLLSMVPQRGAN